MRSISRLVPRPLWTLIVRGGLMVLALFNFCTRYLKAPASLGESMSNEVVNNSASSGNNEREEAALAGRLTARPLPVTTSAAPTGLLRLGLGKLRDGLLYVPPQYDVSRPAPLVLSLHGAGGSSQHGIQLLQEHAERHGFLVLAVDSRQGTWDVLVGGFGPDVEFIDRALAHTFSRYAVDPACLLVAGFSDGASYALSLGLTNGDLFQGIMAFAPGFMAPKEQRGLPSVFVAHGRQDSVLPVDKCSRRIVPQLQRAGYAVQYHEFDGPHTVPTPIKEEAVNWWLALDAS